MEQTENTQLFKPALYAEKKIIQNIVSGVWKAGDTLPPERTLAQQLGITRQTLRETLKSLAAEGWITIQHGKPSVVNDFLNQGSLGILKTLIKHCELIPSQIIRDWLEFRVVVLPEFAQRAVNSDREKILKMLANKPHPSDSGLQFALYDWQLQELLVDLSKNTIVKMIFNDIREPYLNLASRYFMFDKNRKASHQYYVSLEKALLNNNINIRSIVKRAMEQSLSNFVQLINTGNFKKTNS